MMKPFNLEQALAGKPVVTRDGHRVEQLTKFTIVREGPEKRSEEIVLVGVCGKFGEPIHWYADGRFYQAPGVSSGMDLGMEIVRKEGWINIASDSYSTYASAVYPSSKIALTHTIQDTVATIKIEWNE